MTDISVIKMIISVAVWRIYPSWVNDKLWAWEGLGHSGMFWARLSRDDFRSKLEIISFLSGVMSVSKSFFVSRAFERFGAKCSSSGAFGFDDVLGLILKTPLRHWAFFCKLLLRPQVFLENFLSFFQSRAGFTCLTAMAIPKSEQSTLVMVRRKPEWKLDFRTLARSSAEGPSIVVAIGTVVCDDPWSRREKKTQGSQRVIVQRLNPSSSTNQPVLRSPFPRPDVATVSHFAVFVDTDVQVQDGAARGQRRKAVIRDISGVDHRGVTNCWVHRSGSLDRGIAPFFVTWCNYRCWFCVGKPPWRGFYPRSRKKDHFQTLATGVPQLKTWLGTQRVKVPKKVKIGEKYRKFYHF